MLSASLLSACTTLTPNELAAGWLILSTSSCQLQKPYWGERRVIESQGKIGPKVYDAWHFMLEENWKGGGEVMELNEPQSQILVR